MIEYDLNYEPLPNANSKRLRVVAPTRGRLRLITIEPVYIGEDSMGGLRHPDIDIDQILKGSRSIALTMQKGIEPPSIPPYHLLAQ